MSDLQDKMDEREEQDRKVLPTSPKVAASDGGFFTIYRPGQGGWTRLGTAIVSFGFIVATAFFLANDVKPAGHWSMQTTVIVVSIFCVVSSILAWWLQNKIGNVNFLIDTDSEMKKVNWTSRKELIGSTKIVIFFMLAISLLLFVIDMVFHQLFFTIGVLKFGPFVK